MKEVLEILQGIDTKLDDCRYYLTINEQELLFDKLNEISKEIKSLINEIN
jgi:hypothetical protein